MAITKLNASVDLLNDVDTTTAAPANKEVLAWDSSTGQWEPLENNFVEEAPTSGLIYGRANGTWVEVTGGEGGGGTGGAGSVNLAYDKLTPNGTADTFDLTIAGDAREPLGATNLLVSVNGVIQEPGVAFTTAGSTITFTEVPQADDSIDFIVELTNGSHWELNGVNLEYAGEGTKVVVDQFQANGNAVFMDNVGIGYDSPNVKLHVFDNTAPCRMTVQGLGAGNSAGINILGRNSSNTSAPWTIQTEEDLSLSVGTGGTESMRIAASGNVGIGTASPFGPLDVKAATDIHVGIDDSGSDALIYTATDAGQTAVVPLKFQGNSFKFNGSSEFMRIDSSGNVGIGTTSPNTALEVAGSVRCSSGFQLLDSGSAGRGVLIMNGDDPVFQTGTTAGSRSLLFKTEGTERMRIDAAGNVGFGTASPSSDSGWVKFVVVDGGSSNAFIANGGNGHQMNIGAAGGAYIDSVGHSNGEKNFIVFRTVSAANNYSGQERMRISSTGRVDITGSLYVNGTAKIGYSELMTTLVTLRKATMDETQDIRESLRSAIDELVAGFEQEIATMPAPEPEVSTMPAGDES